MSRDVERKLPKIRSNYLAPLPEPEVFDADNPPSRMSQMIRLSIRDVESMLAQGYGYDWFSPSLRYSAYWKELARVTTACAACHAGAVILGLSGDPDASGWDSFGPVWHAAFNALSDLTCRRARINFLYTYDLWPDGFANVPDFEVAIPHASTNWTAHKAAMLELADRLEAKGS